MNFGALDAKVRKELRTSHDIYTSIDVTIFVTHDQEAMELADEIVVTVSGWNR